MNLMKISAVFALAAACCSAVAQELPWYEVTFLGNGTTVDFYDSGYYTLTSGVLKSSQLFDPNGTPVNLDFNVRNVDQFGVAYGSTLALPGYESFGASQDLKNGGAVRVYSNMSLLDGGNSDLVYGQKTPNSGFPWAQTSADPNNLSLFGRVGELIDMNQAGVTLLTDRNANTRFSGDTVYVPGQGTVRLKEPTVGPNGESVRAGSFSILNKISDDGSILGRSGNFGTAFVPQYSLVVWDSLTSEPRFVDLNNLSQQDIDRFGVFLNANEIYGAGGVHSVLANRIVNPGADMSLVNLNMNHEGVIFGTGNYVLPDGSTYSGAFVAKPVPEPATIAVIGLGVCGLLLRRRKR